MSAYCVPGIVLKSVYMSPCSKRVSVSVGVVVIITVPAYTRGNEAPAHRAAQSLTVRGGRARIWILMRFPLELEMDIMPNSVILLPAFMWNDAASAVPFLQRQEAPLSFARLAQTTFIRELLYLAFSSPDPYWGVPLGLVLFSSNYMCSGLCWQQECAHRSFKKWLQRWHFSPAERAF